MNDIRKLQEKIAKAKEAYYNNQSIISDAEYDTLVEELTKLDPINSVLTEVGFKPVSEWVKENHLYSLGSLNKVNFPEELSKWWSSNSETELVVMDKLDGLSLGAEYQNGKLVKAILRGDGLHGENILSNFSKMKNVIKNIPGFSGQIRGEIIVKNSDFQTNFAQDYKNPRNTCSGISRRFEGTGSEHLSFIAYQVRGNEDLTTEVEQLTWLKSTGFEVPNYQFCKNAAEVNALWQKYQDSIRSSLDYDIDGLVIAYNDLEFQYSLGETNSRPRGKMAFKFANVYVKTTITEIEWTVGNSGRLTPIAHFVPVELLGSTVSKASIYNLSYINELGIGVGAEALICKANEIIPRIEEITSPANEIAGYPDSCPLCISELQFEGEYLICNKLNCPARVSGRISNWVSNLNILELGEGLIEKLCASGLVKDVADLYTLTIDQLASLDRMGKKSATNVVKSIAAINPVPLELILGSLSIDKNGRSSFGLLVENGYDTLEKIYSLTQSDLENIKGLGSIKAEALLNGLNENKDLIQKLLTNGLKIKERTIGKLSNLTFVFTGTMVNKRAILEQMVVENGGTNKGSVGKGLSYLVANDLESTSSKAVAAKKHNVKTISENEFLEMIK